MRQDKKTGLNYKQERFCRLYTQNWELFHNGTLCYAAAYGIDLDKLDRTPQTNADGVIIPRSSIRDRKYDECSVQASKALRQPKIQNFLVECLNEVMKDDRVDAELAKVIIQDIKLDAKIKAISEYNKLKARVGERIDLTTKGESLNKISDDDKLKIQRAVTEIIKSTGR